MKLKYKEMKVEFKEKDERFIEIIYNGKVYGEWNNDANCDYPEDLIIGRDLDELVEIGIEIGRQMERDWN